MTRRVTAFATIALLGAFIWFDATATPPNPFAAPAAIALGSGVAASGGFCGALPD